MPTWEVSVGSEMQAQGIEGIQFPGSAPLAKAETVMLP